MESFHYNLDQFELALDQTNLELDSIQLKLDAVQLDLDGQEYFDLLQLELRHQKHKLASLGSILLELRWLSEKYFHIQQEIDSTTNPRTPEAIYEMFQLSLVLRRIEERFDAIGADWQFLQWIEQL